MTRFDILTTILAEISGRPAEFVRQTVLAVSHVIPASLGSDKLFDALSDDEAARLLAECRGKKDRIRLWLLHQAATAQRIVAGGDAVAREQVQRFDALMRSADNN